MSEQKSLPPLTLHRVEWDKLEKNDIVCVGTRLERLVDIALYGHVGPGTALIFGSGHALVQYDIRDNFNELAHFVRLSRADEPGYVQVSNAHLGFAPHTKEE